MKKLMWVLLGLVFLGGAFSLGMYRHWWEPQQRTKITRSASQQAPTASSRGVTTQAPAARAPQSGGSTTTSDALPVDTIINALNIVVGIMGIWMTWVGMRMQRQAMQVTNDRPQR